MIAPVGGPRDPGAAIFFGKIRPPGQAEIMAGGLKMVLPVDNAAG